MGLRHQIKRVLPRSLYGRSLLIIIMPLVLLQVVSAWFFYDRHWDRITWRLAVIIAGDIQNVMEQLDEAPDAAPVILDRARRTMDLEITLTPGASLDGGGAVGSALVNRKLSQALAERVQRPFRIDSSALAEAVVVDIQLADGVMTVVSPGKRLFSSTTYIFILWMVAASLVLLGFASIVMRNQVRPIRRLAAAMDSFGKGREPAHDFKPAGAAEVRLAGVALNRMVGRLRRQIRQRTDMLSGVSHDLRTPLTRMRLRLALLERKAPEEEVAALRAAIAEMERMIEDYLTFARGEGAEAPVQTNLGRLVSERLPAWRRDGVSVTCDVAVDAPLSLPLRPDAMRRCLDNLAGNAARHAASAVRVSVFRRGGAVVALVDDDGPGIPPDRREDAFRPFVRLDTSRNPRTGGTGLGLSIARDVARAHGGDVTLEDSPLGGLRARVTLPV